MTRSILVGQDEHQLSSSAHGNGGDQQPPRHILTSFSFEENEPEQHTHASTTTSDDPIEPNLANLTETELYELVRKSLASLRRYDWNPETGWEEVRS